MWHYNFDYLCHGMNGYKYIDKYRGKNGKWNYVYEGQKARERGIAKSKQTTRNMILRQLSEEGIKNPITGPAKYYDYLRTGKVPESKSSKTTAKQISTRKSEIRQKVDASIDQKAREREIAEGKAAAKDYRQSKVTANDVQRERERAIKEGMSSNRQWNRDAISKGSSVEAAQKARERGIAEGKKSAKKYSTSVGAKKNAELVKILGDMINGTKSDIKKNVHANFKTNEAQRGRAEDINKSVEAAREAQRKKENSLGARIKKNVDSDIATAIALNKSKAKSQKEMLKDNAKEIVDNKYPARMSKEEKAAKQQEREHSRTTAAIDAQNARQRAIEASQARQRQAEAAKQQEAERKQAGNRSVERAQNAREAAIAKSVQTTKETNQAKQVANAAKQQEEERRIAGARSYKTGNNKNVEEAQIIRDNQIRRSTQAVKEKRIEDAVDEALDMIKSTKSDFATIGSYVYDSTLKNFTKNEQENIVLKTYEKMLADPEIKDGQISRAREWILTHYGNILQLTKTRNIKTK